MSDFKLKHTIHTLDKLTITMNYDDGTNKFKLIGPMTRNLSQQTKEETNKTSWGFQNKII